MDKSVSAKTELKIYKKNDPTIAETKNDKLDALLGVLIMTGVFDCSHVAAAELFSAEFGPAFYRAAMGEYCSILV